MTDEFGRLLAGLPRRPVLVVSDRYPPDAGGGAERSLHLMLREPSLRDDVLVVAFDKAIDAPLRRTVDGLETLALPAPAAWPLHRLTQARVERLKRIPFSAKWGAFLAEALRDIAAAPTERARAFAIRRAAQPDGGVALDHRTTPGSFMETAVARIIAHVRPGLVHADNARAILVAAGALAGCSTPLVAVVRDHRFASARFDQTFEPVRTEPEGWAARAAEAFAADALAFRQERLRRADLALVASAHLEERLSNVLPADRIRRLPLTPAPLVAAVAEPSAGFNVLIVGALTPNKGQESFLESWPDLVARVPAARLDLAGEGPSHAALARRLAELGLGRSVRIHGQVEGDALDALYAQAHVVALPTLWAEPFGRVPLEAGAAGRPVVAYAAGGHAETVGDGVTGRLIPPGDSAGFLDALAALAADPALRARFGEAGRDKAADFAPARLAAGLRAVWQEAGHRTGAY